jgi:hypothetical protein
MKTVLERLGAADVKSPEKFQTAISFFMILFFILIGAASLIVLINSPA